ncbi:MAG: permease-like cell division protein FtsX [Patescibacteria group bacterium]
MNYTFWRAIKFAWQDFWRNFWLSFVTITVIVLALLSVNILISLNAMSDGVVNSVKAKVDITVFFKENTSEAKINNFLQKIKAQKEVQEVVLVSKDEALEKFKIDYAGDKAIMEALEEVSDKGNPLLDSLIIKAKDTEDYQVVLNMLSLAENQEIIKSQNFTDHQKIISRVESLSDKVEKFGFGLTAVFAFIAVLIVYNAIRVTIYTHKEEIGVMKLVGAGNSFIRAPFLINTLFYSLFGLIFTAIVIYLLLRAVNPQLSGFLGVYDFSLLSFYADNLLWLFGVQFGGTLILTALSSAVAVGKYLKV